MKKALIPVIIAFVMIPFIGFSQKTFSEGSIVYDITMGNAKKGETAGTSTVFVKGNQSRTEMQNSLGKEVTIHEAKLGTAVILKEYSGQKLMITLTKEDWENKNKADKEVSFELTNETKIIAGYTCKKAIAKLPWGKSFTVYYTPDLLVPNSEYNPMFRNLPGMAMEYEIGAGNTSLIYTAVKISFEPVSEIKFDFPKSGYRVMTYAENQQLKKTK